MTDFDAIRAAHPDLAISLYGYTPGGPVTLEVIDPEGFTATWSGPTAAAVLAQAFPPEPTDYAEVARDVERRYPVTMGALRAAEDDTPAPAEPPTPSIFD